MNGTPGPDCSDQPIGAEAGQVSSLPLSVELFQGDALLARKDEASRWCRQFEVAGFQSDPRWLSAVCRGLRQVPYLLEARRGGALTGILPLAFVKSWLFGRFLVSLPYLNSGGVLSLDDASSSALIDRAAQLADELDVRYLELRHETPHEHTRLGETLTSKVHMRLPLPPAAEMLWDGFKPKVRNQIRKAERYESEIHWGRAELLDAFYQVFSRNMRDLGTPVFSRRLFAAILEEFPGEAELCTVSLQGRPAAAALLVHGPGLTAVPSASSLREFNSQNVNMLMYWHLLQRAVARGQQVFDFGRSSEESSTFRFKKQWGAQPERAAWQYYVRRGSVGDMRVDNRKYSTMIRIWQKLPVALTRQIGPPIVRGIP